MKTLNRTLRGALLLAITLCVVENAWSEPRPREFRPILAKAVTSTPRAEKHVHMSSRVAGSKERLRKLIRDGEIMLVISDDNMDLLIEVESSGNNGAIDDIGRADNDFAYGKLQIRQCYVTDVNKHFGTNLRSTDCLHDEELSRLIVQAYMNIYGKPHFGFQEYARIHNGGPDGHLSTTTDDYWRKVIRAKLSR